MYACSVMRPGSRAAGLTGLRCKLEALGRLRIVLVLWVQCARAGIAIGVKPRRCVAIVASSGVIGEGAIVTCQRERIVQSVLRLVSNLRRRVTRAQSDGVLIFARRDKMPDRRL